VEHSTAILIRRRAWSETSWILTWLTLHHGKISTMAKGARRLTSTFAGKIDLFFIAEISFVPSQKSALHTLREIQVLQPFDASHLSGANLFLCGYFSELVDLAIEPGLPVPEIFDLLSRAVSHLQKTEATHRALDFFEQELARLLGIHHASTPPRTALENHCGRLPASRRPLLELLKT